MDPWSVQASLVTCKLLPGLSEQRLFVLALDSEGVQDMGGWRYPSDAVSASTSLSPRESIISFQTRDSEPWLRSSGSGCQANMPIGDNGLSTHRHADPLRQWKT